MDSLRPEMVRLARSVWIPEELRDDFRAQCLAALAACGSDAVLVGETAARIHQLWLPSALGKIQIATASIGRAAHDMTRTRRPEFVGHRRELPAADRAVVGGLPVTTIARTWLDLANELLLTDLVAAGDSALRLGATADQLDQVIHRSAGERGVRRARAARELLDARSRSRPESHVRVALAVAGLPAFAVNEAIYRASGGWLAEPDLSLDEAKIAIEYQGEDHAEKRQMRRDLTRFLDLRNEGWLALAYGPAEALVRPWLIVSEVREAIRTRAPHLLAVRMKRRRAERGAASR